ncbi:MAG: hypothetical protein A2Z18_09100 [Armatimonadetes bacterium RBG_16_58_9]|nr:MAG: hypothetical protein A2Z18_09100 [Armatimonadetes bacterium RBG_16_58_9]
MVAISGASGTAYARRLIEVLPGLYDTVYLTASENALEIMRQETDASELADLIPGGCESKFTVLDSSDLFAPPASGSHDYEGLVAIPCSMGLIGRIASGVSNDLVTRAADVCLKERRKLVLVARETPLNVIQLRNMTSLAESGAVILPACPAFYHKPRSIDELVDFVVDRVLRALGLDKRLTKGWGE